jgi:hypothetical protein
VDTVRVITDPRLRDAVDLACQLLRAGGAPRALLIWRAAREHDVSTSEVAHQLNLRSQAKRGRTPRPAGPSRPKSRQEPPQLFGDVSF